MSIPKLLANLFILSVCLLSFARTGHGDQPNIVLLLADDLGYGELGCQGNLEIPTPAIDSISSSGARFTQAYVTAPNCSPSRAGLLTGKIPTRFGYEFNPIGARNEAVGVGLPSEQLTLAEALHDQGYTTGLIGKWHLGGEATYHPHRHGFDEFFGFSHEGHYFAPLPYRDIVTMLRRKSLPGGGQGRWKNQAGDLIYSTHMGHNEPDYDANNPIIHQGQPIEETEYLTDAFTREAVSFIQRHADKPFFLYLAYNAVHSPLQAKKADLARVANIKDDHRRIFAGMMVALDDSVGTILKTLEQQNIEDRTIVIFLSDNGGPTRELTSSNKPLRGEKGSMYEGGLRVPLLIRWPDVTNPGQTIDTPVSSLDLFPTIAGASGIPAPSDLDGVNLRSLLEGRQSNQPRPQRVFFWRQGHKAALRIGDWKLVNMKRHRGDPANRRWELYDLNRDLAEAQDLAKEQPDRLETMIGEWDQLNRQMKSPLFR